MYYEHVDQENLKSDINFLHIRRGKVPAQILVSCQTRKSVLMQLSCRQGKIDSSRKEEIQSLEIITEEKPNKQGILGS